jgi:hypothetical protein
MKRYLTIDHTNSLMFAQELEAAVNAGWTLLDQWYCVDQDGCSFWAALLTRDEPTTLGEGSAT